MEIIRAAPGDRLNIGRKGEHLARQVQFDLTPWAKTYGEGRAELFYQRPGDLHTYPIAARRQGNLLLWDITRVDTAQAGKNGRTEIRYYVEDVLVILEISYILVEQTLDITEKIPAMPKADWFEQVLEQVRRVEAPVTSPPIINGETGTWMIYDRETEQYENTGYPATGRDGKDGMDGLNGRDGAQGPIGPTGPQGERGPRGYEGPEGPQGERGPRGYDGEDGKSDYIKSVSYQLSNADGGENVITLHTSLGRSYDFRVRNGSKGTAGSDGADGADGKDYILTTADKAEIAGMVEGAVIVAPPAFVSSVDEMTDTSKVYVLSETGRLWAYTDKSREEEVTITDRIEGTTDNPYHTDKRLASDTSQDTFSTGAGCVMTPYIDLSRYAGKTIQLHLEGVRYATTGTYETWIQVRTYKADRSIEQARVYTCDNKSDANCFLYASSGISMEYIDETHTVLTIDVPYTYGSTNAEIWGLRFCGKGELAASNVYITCTEKQTVTGGGWTDTGMVYAPALTEEDKAEIAEEVALMIDSQLLSVIGDGAVSV